MACSTFIIKTLCAWHANKRACAGTRVETSNVNVTGSYTKFDVKVATPFSEVVVKLHRQNPTPETCRVKGQDHGMSVSFFI